MPQKLHQCEKVNVTHALCLADEECHEFLFGDHTIAIVVHPRECGELSQHFIVVGLLHIQFVTTQAIAISLHNYQQAHNIIHNILR